MILPNYEDGSIVNLMSSIRNAFGGISKYKELSLLSSKELEGCQNIVLMVIDGLGFEFLKKNFEGTVFEKALRGSITSVFPPTTASAITTFGTGTAPQQHAFTGWYIFLKEYGLLTTILKFMPRVGGMLLSDVGCQVGDLTDAKSFSEAIPANSYIIQHKRIINSDFSSFISGDSKRLHYKSLNGFFRKIRKAVNSSKKKKYVYAYWDEFDHLTHLHGTGGLETKNHFQEINKGLSKLLRKLEGTNTKLIITADHGLINVPEEKVIHLKDHPKLNECLTMPFSGEARTVYCYVKTSKTKLFEDYVNKKLKHYCTLYKSEELVEKNLFGLYKSSPKLFDRIGDYILIMKDNYSFKNNLFNEVKPHHLGKHGGVSKEEMIVPLVVFNL